MAADSGGESTEEVTDSEEKRWKENERVKKCMLFCLFSHSSLSQCTLQRAPLGGALTENPLSTWLGLQVSKTTCTLLY